MNDQATIQQVGNIYPDTAEFKNKTSGRVYSPEGIAPTLNTAEGGEHHTSSSKRLIAQIPRNADSDGCARCLKAGYYKMGVANFLKHENNGFVATCIIEIWETTD